jgi:hypothetical protein
MNNEGSSRKETRIILNLSMALRAKLADHYNKISTI